MAAFLALCSFVQAPILLFIWITLKNFMMVLGIFLGTIVTLIGFQIILGLWSIWHLDNNIEVVRRYNYLRANTQAMIQLNTINNVKNLRY